MKYPALTVPVEITAAEHARIAAFCEKVGITVVEYVTFVGIGVSVDEYDDEDVNCAGLLYDIGERFGRKVPGAYEGRASARPPEEPAPTPRPFVLYPDDLPALAKLGAAFGLDAAGFWGAYKAGTLPGQRVGRVDEDALEKELARVLVVECRDPKLKRRLCRAARFDGRSLRGWTAMNLAGGVRCNEEDAILHPETGQVLGDRLALERIEGRGYQWAKQQQQMQQPQASQAPGPSGQTA